MIRLKKLAKKKLRSAIVEKSRTSLEKDRVGREKVCPSVV